MYFINHNLTFESDIFCITKQLYNYRVRRNGLILRSSEVRNVQNFLHFQSFEFVLISPKNHISINFLHINIILRQLGENFANSKLKKYQKA